MSLDERSNVGHLSSCRLRVGDIATPPTLICSESCEFSKDGYCDDGGFGSDFDYCAFGTDCEVGLPPKNDLQNNYRFVPKLCQSLPYHILLFFPNALSSDGRTVTYARVTNFPSVSDVDLIVSLLYHCVC
jgi:hypothetical protein